MRPRVALEVLALALASAVLPLSLVRATHVPLVDDIVKVAVNEPYYMECVNFGTEIQCDAVDIDLTWATKATIKPGSGNLVSLSTVAAVNQYYVPLSQNGTFFQGWMVNMHVPACGPTTTARDQVAGFIASVASLTRAGTVSPLTIPGECNLTGGLNVIPGGTAPTEYDYWVNAGVIVPPPPTPSPTPTPTPTPVVTPPPSATPRPTPSPTPTSSATLSPTATASPTSTASSSATPTATPTSSPTPTPRPSPSGTPEQTVAGITFAPEPSVAVPDVAGDPIPWAASVHSPADVSTDPAALGASAAMAMLLLLFMGFVGEMFNNTVKANYDELLGWWHKSWPGRLTAAWARLWRPRP